MKIMGLQKLTLLDFPGRMACTVFTDGCNFRCPFCHNASLVVGERWEPLMSEEEFFAFECLVEREMFAIPHYALVVDATTRLGWQVVDAVW